MKNKNPLLIWHIFAAIISAIAGFLLLTYFVPSVDFLALSIPFFPLFAPFVIGIGAGAYYIIIKKFFKTRIKTSIYSVILIIFICFYIFIVSYPIGPVEDDAFLKIMCKLKPAHEIKVSPTAWPCHEGYWDYEKYIIKWDGFHGCNNSTKGFYLYNGKPYIHNVENCVRKNPFQM